MKERNKIVKPSKQQSEFIDLLGKTNSVNLTVCGHTIYGVIMNTYVVDVIVSGEEYVKITKMYQDGLNSSSYINVKETYGVTPKQFVKEWLKVNNRAGTSFVRKQRKYLIEKGYVWNNTFEGWVLPTEEEQSAKIETKK
jgi:hypothetical protein